MKSKIQNLTPEELKVYAEIAHASIKGICKTPATIIRNRLNKIGIHQYKKTLDSLANKGLIAQEVICNGVPRKISLIPASDKF